MPGTRSGNSYNPNQGLREPGPSQPHPSQHALPHTEPLQQTNPQNPLNSPPPIPFPPNISQTSTQNPPHPTPLQNEPVSLLHQLQHQMELVTSTLGTIVGRLEHIEERSNTVDHRRGRVNQGGNVAIDAEEVGEHVGDYRNRDGRAFDEISRGIRVDVSDFTGRQDPDVFQDWLVSLEDYFEWFSVPENRKVRFVKLKLKGAARAWWGNVEEQLSRTRQPPIQDWVEMKARLETKYLPANYEQLVYEDMLRWMQGMHMTVDQYTEKFHDLSVGSTVGETTNNF